MKAIIGAPRSNATHAAEYGAMRVIMQATGNAAVSIAMCSDSYRWEGRAANRYAVVTVVTEATKRRSWVPAG